MARSVLPATFPDPWSDEEATEVQPYERSSAEVAELIAAGACLIDVRTAHEQRGQRAGRFRERIDSRSSLDRRDETSSDGTVIFTAGSVTVPAWRPVHSPRPALTW